MTPADVPAIPPNSVEVCESHAQTVCPLVTMAAPLLVTVPNTIDNLPELSGRIVRFEPVNGERGAWVRLTRGGELWFPLRDLTLTVTR